MSSCYVLMYLWLRDKQCAMDPSCSVMLMSSYIIMGPNASATAVSVPIYIPISMLIFSL